MHVDSYKPSVLCIFRLNNPSRPKHIRPLVKIRTAKTSKKFIEHWPNSSYIEIFGLEGFIRVCNMGY